MSNYETKKIGEVPAVKWSLPNYRPMCTMTKGWLKELPQLMSPPKKSK